MPILIAHTQNESMCPVKARIPCTHTDAGEQCWAGHRHVHAMSMAIGHRRPSLILLWCDAAPPTWNERSSDWRCERAPDCYNAVCRWVRDDMVPAPCSETARLVRSVESMRSSWSRGTRIKVLTHQTGQLRPLLTRVSHIERSSFPI